MTTAIITTAALVEAFAAMITRETERENSKPTHLHFFLACGVEEIIRKAKRAANPAQPAGVDFDGYPMFSGPAKVVCDAAEYVDAIDRLCAAGVLTREESGAIAINI